MKVNRDSFNVFSSLLFYLPSIAGLNRACICHCDHVAFKDSISFSAPFEQKPPIVNRTYKPPLKKRTLMIKKCKNYCLFYSVFLKGLQHRF